jgi:glutaminase
MSSTTLPLQRYLTALHQKYQALDDGAVATYIPELAKADPDWFGICVVTTDGYAYAVGESDRHFTVQSVSKPAVYAAALADRGREGVLHRVGVEPSGEAFNSISLDPETGALLNPMINAGAIATTGLVAGATAVEQWERIADVISTFCGRSLTVDGAVYRSESKSGFRNRAIAWMLKNFGIIEGDPMPVLENYFRQCSILVTCRDLAFMAATLANGGVHPRTGKRAVPADEIQAVLSIMATCGMYDYAGSWLYEVGLPAKSSVSGGVIAVMPGRFGIAIFSPRLDENGNSARGIAVCREISREFGLRIRRVRISLVGAEPRVFGARSSVAAGSLNGNVDSAAGNRVPDQVLLPARGSGIRWRRIRRPEPGPGGAGGRQLHPRHAPRQLFGRKRRPAPARRSPAFGRAGKALVFSRIRGRAVVEAALRHALPEGDNGS